LVEGTVAIEQLVANSAAMMEHFNNFALRNALYLEFQMLVRIQRHKEINAIYDRMCKLTKTQHMVNGEPQRNGVPHWVAARLEMDSSEDESSLEQHQPKAKPKNDSDYATDGDSFGFKGSSSGGDPSGGDATSAWAQAAGIKAALDSRDIEPV
jgi:hypothetical protein